MALAIKYIVGLLPFISSVIAAPATGPDAYLVENLPGIDGIPESIRPIMHAGQIVANEKEGSNYFFWRFKKPGSDFKKTIIWLNGGPGCSSLDGALMENGPLRVKHDKSLYLNSGSWYHAADMVFVDQPGGTGFSTTKEYDTDLAEIGDDFASFLKNYIKALDESTNEIYIAGESYAGEYIPFIAKSILALNKENGTNINLKGLLIGNGQLNPNIVGSSYVPYLTDYGILKKTDVGYDGLNAAHLRCVEDLKTSKADESFLLKSCQGLLDYITEVTLDDNAAADSRCINVYNLALKDAYPDCGQNWPYFINDVKAYLANDDVVRALNVDTSKAIKWKECDKNVFASLTNSKTKHSASYLLPELLEELPIMLFYGENDLVCNVYSGEYTVKGLTWKGQTGFSDQAIEYDWRYDGITVGKYKKERNLSFVKVHDASHMVPYDKPAQSRGLFDLFTGNSELVKDEMLFKTVIETPVYNMG